MTRAQWDTWQMSGGEEETAADFWSDPHVGTAVELLLEQGHETAVALLLDVVEGEFAFVDLGMALSGEADDVMIWRLNLVVPHYIVERFSAEVCSQILSALNEVRLGVYVQDIRVSPQLIQGDWRSRAEKRLGHGPSNQAQVGPRLAVDGPREDRLGFRSATELRVYRALKRVCLTLPATERFAILPNAGARIGENTMELDFVIAYKGRVGVIEVDGPTHRGRAATDKSRDRLVENHGIAYVDRWTVEDADSEDDLEKLIKRFLLRLQG